MDWQAPLEQLDRREWDVAVIGGGPAGSIAALHMARQGLRVVLVERHRFPREKVCGDGLIADALAALRRAGLYEAVRAESFAADRCILYSPSRLEISVTTDTLVIRRSVLDSMVAGAAAEAGAAVCEGQIVKVTTDGSWAALDDGSARPIRARVAVIATGADVSLLSDRAMVSRIEPSAVAARCYAKSRVRITDVMLSWDRAILPGYAWIFPLPGGEYNIGCGVFNDGRRRGRVNLREMFETFAREFPPARTIMSAAESVTPLRGATLRCGLSGTPSAGSPNVLAIGEAIGTTFPFSGEGVGKAMETGEMAAAVIVEAFRSGDLARLGLFPARVKSLEPRYRGYEAAQKWIAWPAVADLVARRAQKSRFLQRALPEIFAETLDPRTVFSVGGLLKAMLT